MNVFKGDSPPAKAVCQEALYEKPDFQITLLVKFRCVIHWKGPSLEIGQIEISRKMLLDCLIYNETYEGIQMNDS